jgi:hypothetical protein
MINVQAYYGEALKEKIKLMPIIIPISSSATINRLVVNLQKGFTRLKKCVTHFIKVTQKYLTSYLDKAPLTATPYPYTPKYAQTLHHPADHDSRCLR